MNMEKERLTFKTSFCSKYEELLIQCQNALEAWGKAARRSLADGMARQGNRRRVSAFAGGVCEILRSAAEAHAGMPIV